MKRVVVTGRAAISALGSDWPSIAERLRSMKSAIVRMDDWDKYADLNTRLAAPITDFEKPAH